MITLIERLRVYKELKGIIEKYDDSSLFSSVCNDRDFFGTTAQGKHVGKAYCAMCGILYNNLGARMAELPELLAQKPKTGWKPKPAFWWSPFEPKKRLEAVNRAIDLAEKKLLERSKPMPIDSLEGRLKIYEHLLEIYEAKEPEYFKTVCLPGNVHYDKYPNQTYYNLCKVCQTLTGKDFMTFWMNYNLPELDNFEPEQGWAEQSNFWWNPFITEPRVEAIRKAIKLTKKLVRESYRINKKKIDESSESCA